MKDRIKQWWQASAAPEKLFLVLRMSTAPGVLTWWLLDPDREVLARTMSLLIPVFALYSALIYLAVFTAPRHTRQYYALGVFFDLAFLTVLTQLTGNNHSVFQIGFFLVVFLSAYYFGVWVGIGMAMASSALTFMAALATASLSGGSSLVLRLDLITMPHLGDFGLLLGFKLVAVLAVYEFTRYQETQQRHTAQLAEQLQFRSNQLGEAYMQIIASWSAAVDAKDRYTERHSERVARWSRDIAATMNMTEEEVEEIYRAGLLHDVGKIAVSDTILRKAGPLTYDQWLSVQEHASLGADIVGRVAMLRKLQPSILYHHERGDGSGYPKGLPLRDIPRGARIIAVADSFEAMTSERPYRPARTAAEALGELREQAGTKYDQAVVDAFAALIQGGMDPLASVGSTAEPQSLPGVNPERVVEPQFASGHAELGVEIPLTLPKTERGH